MNMLKQQELRYKLNSDIFSRQEKIKVLPIILTILLAILVLLLSK
ncbi:hypothetical protein [Arsenophonus nasoniae]|uniref:Uncharacterized protein n=1 Tax=Arsenophonus nasoniae TaxID=638 RepID=A0AA95K1B8_9GAMM|nr:hypothetical protein [Arsenophonus nasoniae]WGL96464.1 hypothetical protein QE207_07955 [Arsenophonus nasoniae]